MAIYVRNENGELESYKIVGLKGEKGDKGDSGVYVGDMNEAPEDANIVIDSSYDETDFSFPTVDDTTISNNKLWSSSKIENYVLNNVGTIWKEIIGSNQEVIDSSMEGFLREVEILGNTIQNPEDLSNIQHLGTWNELKQGYEIEIKVANSSNEDNLNYEEYKTTILLPCQLSKLGNVVDRLYWDNEKGRYVIEKKVGMIKCSDNDGITTYGFVDTISSYNTLTMKQNGMLAAKSRGYAISTRTPLHQGGIAINKVIWFDWGKFVFAKDKTSYPDMESIKKEVLPLTIFYQLSTLQLIETNITEQIKLPTFINTTYITVNGGIQGTIKCKAPVDGSAVMNTLSQENRELKNEISALTAENQELKATNEVQDELINTTMLATDEVYSLLEPLLINMLSTENNDAILNMYVAMVQRGLKKIEDIPERYKEQAIEILKKDEVI